ncbi:hypothetical protein FRC19_002132 [Serendipita sp. 401]|nr:hypothetical protein FRC19_002132 [Serendipita sp. 401]KAG8830194.1 hypothetical protein FRC18_008540 [Serendipita sp. 400]
MAAVKNSLKKANLIPDTILYLFPISCNRILGSELTRHNLLMNSWKTDRIPNIVFVTTMWDHVEEEVGAKREEELKSKFWAEWVAKGCEVRRFNRTVHDSALNVLRALPAKMGASHSYEADATGGTQTEEKPAFLQVVLEKFSGCLSCRL